MPKKKPPTSDAILRALEAATDYAEMLIARGNDRKAAVEATRLKYPKVSRAALLSQLRQRRLSKPPTAPEFYMAREDFLKRPAKEDPVDWIPVPTYTDVTFTRSGDHVEIADKLREVLARSCGIDRIVNDEGDLYRYMATMGRWVPIGESNLAQMLHVFSGRPIYQVDLQSGDYVRNDDGDLTVAGLMEMPLSKVTGTITTLRKQCDYPGFFGGAANGIAFRDKFVEASPKGLLTKAHSHVHRARHGLLLDLPKAGATPKNFLRLLKDIFHDEEDTPAKIAAIQEFGGACLCGIATRYQRAIAFNGTGGNGKSLVLEILQGCFPPGSMSAVPPQADRFEYPRIRGKLLNCVADIPKGALEETAFLKMAITGDQITCRDVGEASITFQPIAGHAYGMNRFPDVNDYSEGFTRRWILIDFPYPFTPARKGIASMILDVELPALVRWFLEGAVRLQQNRGYTIPACHQALLTRWKAVMDPIAVYLDEQIEPGDATVPMLTAAVIYDAFLRWCQGQAELRHEIPPSLGAFGRRLTGANFPKRLGSHPAYRVKIKRSST